MIRLLRRPRRVLRHRLVSGPGRRLGRPTGLGLLLLLLYPWLGLLVLLRALRRGGGRAG